MKSRVNWAATMGIGRVTGLLLFGATMFGCSNGDRAPLPGAKAAGGEAGVSEEAAIATPPVQGGPGATAPGMSSMDSPGAELEQGAAVPLKLTGIGSKEELDHALAKIEDVEARAAFEQAFRFCFSNDKGQRRFQEAVPLLENVIAKFPDFAPAYRTLAYAHFNLSFNMPKANELYEKAIAVDPNYGEAHYALSFMLTQSDMTRARQHFDKAMALGVPDERNLKEQFFK